MTFFVCFVYINNVNENNNVSNALFSLQRTGILLHSERAKHVRF